LEPIKGKEFQNKYDHNFLNKFCFCDQEYDSQSNDFMISCIYCQDFYHIGHLKLTENEVIKNKYKEFYIFN